MSLYDYTPNPDWIDSIREGRFLDAENQLTRKAVEKVSEAYTASQVQEKCQEILNQNAGEYSQYLENGAAQRVQRQFAEGKIQTPQGLIDAYQDAVRQEVRDFNAKVMPGYARSTYDPGVPADREVLDYCAQRRELAKGHPRDEGR